MVCWGQWTRDGGDVWDAELAGPNTAWLGLCLGPALSQCALLPRLHAGAHRPGLLPAEQEEQEPRAQRGTSPGGPICGSYSHHSSLHHRW